MWKRLRNGSSRSSSSSLVSVADAQLRVAPTPTPVAHVRSSQSSQSSQQSGEDLHELLAFHKTLVQGLGEDLQKRCAELDKVKSQIDEQRIVIGHLSSRKTDYKRRVAELETQVKEDKTRIDELIKSVNNLRKFDAQTQASDHMVPLGGIVKNALIEQLESDVERLTQQVFDHDHEMQALATSHEHEVSELHAHMERLRSELKHERSVVAKYTWDLPEMTRKGQTSEIELQQRVLEEALNEQGRFGDATTRDEKLAQALSYTKELSKSGRLLQDGKEVELHHLQTLCGLAQAQAGDIVRLRAANADLLVTNTGLQDKMDSITQAKPSGADVFASSHRRNVTWDLPLRNNETLAHAESHVTSKLRKHFAIHLPSPRRDTAHRTAPLFSPINPHIPALATPTTPFTPSLAHTIANLTRRLDHLRTQLAAAQLSPRRSNPKDTIVLQREFAAIHARLLSSVGDINGTLGMTSDQIAQVVDQVLQRFTAVRHGDLGEPKEDMATLEIWAEEELQRAREKKETTKACDVLSMNSEQIAPTAKQVQKRYDAMRRKSDLDDPKQAPEKVLSSPTRTSGFIRDGRIDIAAVADSIVEQYRAVRDNGSSWGTGVAESLSSPEEGRVRSAEHVQAESYLFGDIPMVFSAVG
ncbi:hypothetical protein PSPO01_13882 [Paraphaeosphaeria sporulosa]